MISKRESFLPVQKSEVESVAIIRGMDYQVFLVRPSGHGGGRASKGVTTTRILRILEDRVSISPIANLPSSYIEYPFEWMSNVLPSLGDDHDFKFDFIHIDGRTETLKFSCDSRSALLTAILNKLDDVNSSGVDFPLKKHSNQRGGLVDTVLRVRCASIVKMITTGVRQEHRKINPSKRMNFIDILKVEVLSDDEHVLLLYFKSRILRLSLKDISQFILSLQENMKRHLNHNVEIFKITSSTMVDNISAFSRKTGGSPILYSFQVLKKVDIRKEERIRIVSISKEHLIEKSGDGTVTSLHSLKDIAGIVVKDADVREVVIEFKSWRPVQYFIDARNDFLASMADVMESLGISNFSFHSELFLPHTFPERPNPFYQNECEQYYCSQILAATDAGDVNDLLNVLKEYACNINVGESQCTDPRVLKKVVDILQNSRGNTLLATCCCLVIQRLLASRPCFEAVKNMSDISLTLIQCLQSRNPVLSYAATNTIRATVKLPLDGPVSDVALLSKLEHSNKGAVINVDNMQELVSYLHIFSLAKDNALQLYGVLQTFLALATSLPQEIDSERGWPKVFENCIIGAAGVLCRLCRSPNFVIYRSTSLLLKALLTQTSPPIGSQLQKVCLDRGVILIHLKDAIFGTDEELRFASGNLVFLMIERNRASKKLLEALLPKGIMHFYDARINQLNLLKESASSRFTAWMDILDLLRNGNFETPILLWNDAKRMELKKFLEDHVKAFNTAAENNKDILINSSEMQLTYSTAREGSVINDIHLEILVDKSPEQNDPWIDFWKLRDPLSTFQAVLQAMLVGFTPLFDQMGLPEVDLKLGAHVLTWIYERHAEDIQGFIEKMNVIEVIVGMLRAVIGSEYQVFVFKLVVFLLSTLEIGGKYNALRFLRGGGAIVLVHLIVLSLSKCSRDKYAFESDGWNAINAKNSKISHFHETVLVKQLNGQMKSVRVPSGRFYQVLDKAVQDGSVDAKEGVHWQHETVHEKLQLGLAVDLLEAIMRLSGIDSNIEEVPPPAACTHLAKEELLCHLVQILLWAKGSVFGRILDILAYVVKVDSDAMNRLYKLGAYEILLWKLLAGDLTDANKSSIVGFIRQSHLLQDPESVFNGPLYLQAEEQFPWHASILRLFLPDGVILRLMAESPETFATFLNSEQESPEVIWRAEMRDRLVEYLKAELDPYVKFRASDPLALYIHVPKAPLLYPELSESVFCAPFYLENLLDWERFPNHQINDPLQFLNSLMLDLRKCAADVMTSDSSTSSTAIWKTNLSRIHLLLRAQAYLVQRFPQLVLSHDIESVVITLATPALRVCLAQTDDSPAEIIDVLGQTATVLRRCCRSTTRELDVSQASLDFALGVLSLATNVKYDESIAESNSKFETAVNSCLLLLDTIASSRSGRERLWRDTRWRGGLWFILNSATADAIAKPPRGLSPSSFSALTCLKHFAEDEIYCERILNEGWYMLLLLLAIPSATITMKAHDSKSALFYSSADVFASLVRSLIKVNSPSQEKRKKCIYGAISRLIPMPLLACLLHEDAPEKFITTVCSEFMHPEGIWTHDMRAELLRSMEDRLQHHNSTLLKGGSLIDNEVEWLEKFNYECLREEVLAEGLFVRGLSSTSWEGFVLPPGHAYIDAMQDYLQLNTINLLISQPEATPHLAESDDHNRGIEETTEIQVACQEQLSDDDVEQKKQASEEDEQKEQLSGGEVDKKELASGSEIEQKEKLLDKAGQIRDGPTEQEEAVMSVVPAEKTGDLEKCLCTLAALRECLNHAVKEGRDDILEQFRHSILSGIVLSGRSLPQVQIEVASIVKALASTATGQDMVLNSDLIRCLVIQLWQSSARDSRYRNEQVLMSTLEAILLLAENIPATIQATNFFTKDGLLLPVLAIFAKVNPPSLFDFGISEGENMELLKITKAGQLLAAQILGQLLLAGCGISRRTKLVKDLSIWRTGSVAVDHRHASSFVNRHTSSFPNRHSSASEGIEEATDMYELFDIIEKGVEENADPAGLRTMVLLFPIDFLTMLAREPSKACDLHERRHWSPRLVWDEDSRKHLNLRLEAEMVKLRDSFVNQGLSAIPSWSITQGQPVFLRWTLATFQENDTRSVYKDSGDVDYSRELYLGGFFIDQFLRNPEFDFGISLEERFLREVRKAIVLGALSQQKDSQELDFDDRRRLLLSLLLLFKLRPPLLLRHSNFDIFFPVFGFISGGSSRERRGLTQVAILLFHCIATHSDIADCMSSDELMQTLASLLDLRVPTSVTGFTGTDPRVCSLMLLLRLGRLSSSAVEVALRLEIIPKLAVLVEKSTDVNLRQRAADCLAVMCADKRKGAEVLKLLEKLMPRDRNTTRPSWNQPVGDIRDEIVDSKTLKHFLQQRYPSSWWVSDSSDSHSGSDTEFSGSVTVVEASLTFSGPSLT